MYTLGEAAKATGKSKSTILRAIQKNGPEGKISACKDHNGQWNIDPAELHRVFPVYQPERSDDAPRNPKSNTIGTPDLHAELAATRALAEERQKTIDDLRDRLDREAEERRQVTIRLLEHEKPKAPEPPASLWRRLFG